MENSIYPGREAPNPVTLLPLSFGKFPLYILVFW